MALEQGSPPPFEFEAAVKLARSRAAATGELRAAGKGLSETFVPDELRDFVRQILADGTYARTVERIGREDPDLANS